MKIAVTFLFIPLIVFCSGGKAKIFTGSTPADPEVKTFLGIPLADSIDFIRWKLTLEDDHYHLSCNYGIGKPNTNGFIDGGKTVELTGELKKEKNYYRLRNGNNSLSIAQLNDDLIHLMNENDALLVGNGGWSYTLNNIAPIHLDDVTLLSSPTQIKDSIEFEGRTPCGIPGVVAPGTECYKLKWLIVLYPGSEKSESGNFKILGTPYRSEGVKTGTWRINTGKNGRTIYQLNDKAGKAFLYLLKLDEHVLVFTDAEGKLLVGDEDFSYTMNRRTK